MTKHQRRDTRSLSGVGSCDSMLTCSDMSNRTCTRNKSYRKNNRCKLEIDLFCKGFRERDIVPPMFLMVERSPAVQYLFLGSLLAANFCTRSSIGIPWGCTVRPYAWAPRVQNDAKYHVTSRRFNDKTKAK